jgi:dsDNA-specific endonuclease/ATPase MutS2
MKANNEFEKAVLNHLEEAEKNNPKLAEALKQEGKTLTDCCNYIVEEVKKKKVNVMTNLEVFALSEVYYLSKKEIKTKKINCRVVVAGENAITSVTPPAAEPKPKKKKKELTPADGTQLSMFELIS